MAAASEGIADGGSAAAAAPAAPLCTSVRVAVRVRPMVGTEALDGSRSCVFLEDGPLPQQIVVLDKAFDFDVAFSPGVTQDVVYESTAKPLLEKFFQGFNATVLAYGQTGSGKTFTMGSTLGPGPNDESAGIIPRLLQDIFGHMAENTRQCVASGKGEEGHDAFPWRLQLSYLEIYKEEVKDLLRFQSGGQGDLQSLTIREDAGGAGVMVAGLSLHEVQSLEAVSELLYRGTLCRSTASTNMNKHSSRSHAVCTLYLEGNVGDKQVTSKFHLVDLAGSERAKRTGAEGDRLKEGITINRGLLALGNVISALTDPTRRGVNGGFGHIPYRDAKITRLLQDSLGGNSYTVMIACVSPADSNMDETVNTLRYAQRARSIKNMATQNCMVGGDQSYEVGNLKKEVKLLQLQLAQARSTGVTGGGGGGFGDGAAAELLSVLKEENKRLRETVKDLERTARGASEEAVMAAFRVECLKVRCEQLGALAKEAGLELPPGLVVGDDAALPVVDEVGREVVGDGGATGDGHHLQQQEPHAVGDAEEEPETFDGELEDAVHGELASLDAHIRQKEEAMASMFREEKCMASLRSHFEGTISRLQEEVKAFQGEREQLAQALSTTQTAGAKADPAVVAAMRARERELERTIKELQAKEASHRRVMQLKAKAEHEAAKLRLEIDEAKKRQGALLRRIRQETQRLTKEKRTKELEAVRLRRNESRMKFEYEKKLDENARQEAVLRRKVEGASAASQRYQETIRKLTEGSRAHKAKGIEGGFRQQERHKELQRFVEREMEVCGAVMHVRARLKEHLDRRTEAAQHLHELSERVKSRRGDDDEISLLRAKMQAEARLVEEVSVIITDLQKELMDLEARAGGKGDGLDEDVTSVLPAADEPWVIFSTKRWAQIKTLGEARQVLAMLFESALNARQQDGNNRRNMSVASTRDMTETRVVSKGPTRIPKPAATAAAALAAHLPSSQTGAEIMPKEGGGSASSTQVFEVSETETESDVDEDNDDDDDEDDSDYNPLNSPSQRKRGKAGSRRRSKEGAGLPIAHPKQALKGMGRRKDGEEKRASIEDEIDALLSDGGGGGDEWLPSMVEPLFKYTVADLKRFLKGAKLPITGRKELLLQRVRDHLAKTRQVESSSDSLFSPTAQAPPPAEPLPTFTDLTAAEKPTATAAAQPLEKTLAPKLVAISNTTSLGSAVPTPSTNTASATAPKVTSKTAAPEPPRPRAPLADIKNRSAASASGAHSFIKPATNSFRPVSRRGAPATSMSKAQRVPCPMPTSVEYPTILYAYDHDARRGLYQAIRLGGQEHPPITGVYCSAHVAVDQDTRKA